ncbi:MAG: ChbG/HpnK family deacetylase, partial [Bacteroidota bacterium]
MRKSLLFFSLWPMLLFCQDDEIYLLVRADDMGFCHAANEACMEVFEKGICRSVEIMVPTPWFPEAVEMLKKHADYDVGIHLCLTSEWHNLKWRPLTNVPSLVDENGYFVSSFWGSQDRPEASNFQKLDWEIEEVEQELRAQIELARRLLPHISHLSFHMGGDRFDPRIDSVFQLLAQEYDLDVNLE